MNTQENQTPLDIYPALTELVKDIKINHVRDPIKQAKGGEWDQGADKWIVTFKNGESVDYYTGTVHRVLRSAYYNYDYKRLKNATPSESGFIKFIHITKPVNPKALDVLFSLTIDASACDESFSDWCSNFGYDTDSRKALDLYLKCQANAEILRKNGFSITLLQEAFMDY